MRARLVPPSTSIVYYSNVQRRSQPLHDVYHNGRVSVWWQQCLLGRPIIRIFKTERNFCDFDGYCTCTAKLQKWNPCKIWHISCILFSHCDCDWWDVLLINRYEQTKCTNESLPSVLLCDSKCWPLRVVVVVLLKYYPIFWTTVRWYGFRFWPMINVRDKKTKDERWSSRCHFCLFSHFLFSSRFCTAAAAV